MIIRDQSDTSRVSASVDKRTGNSLVAAALHQCGITRVVGITGTPVDKIFPACVENHIRAIGTRHQQTAVLMAAAANYVAGRIESAVVVSAGPAVTNALTGVLVARDNGWPVIVMGGRRPVHQEGMGYFQELDAVPIYRSVTKWAATVARPSDVMATVTRAYEIASSGRPGPVYLDLPEDVLDATAMPDAPRAPTLPSPLEADRRTMAECVALVRTAQRPLLIVGEDVRWTLCENALRDFVERNSIPFVTTSLARGFLSDDHPLCANAVRRWIPSQADLVLMAGAWFDWRFRFGAELAPTARVIHVGIDPATLGKNVPLARTVHADSGHFLTQLEAMLRETGDIQAPQREPWLLHVSAACVEKRLKHARWVATESNPMGPQAVFAALREFLPKDAIVVLDGNITLSAGQALLSAQTPCSCLDPGWTGCMGVGIPMGMGAKLSAPARMVVVVCGDFGFGLSAMDLETAVRQRIPIITIVMNNDGIGGANRQVSMFPHDYPELFSRFQPALRYERIIEVFGGHSEFVADAVELRPALERAASSGLPACINVRVDPFAPHPGFW